MEYRDIIKNMHFITKSSAYANVLIGFVRRHNPRQARKMEKAYTKIADELIGEILGMPDFEDLSERPELTDLPIFAAVNYCNTQHLGELECGVESLEISEEGDIKPETSENWDFIREILGHKKDRQYFEEARAV